MPRRDDLESILIIGSGPIVIGQACEFDYSGTQACRVLREEGFRVVLVNSNPATIMTDPDFADATYVEPLDVPTVTRIIEQERPDAVLATLGGQTALNLAVGLHDAGVLDRYEVELIGAGIEAIHTAEDRSRFKAAMTEIGLDVPRSGFAYSLDEALAVAEKVGYPLIVRPSFILGGGGTGIASDPDEMRRVAGQGLAASPVGEILIEQSVAGWKEFELEVMRDHADNAVIVCSIENLDPMGVHTGDSITVAPAQTLTDVEYQRMRDAAFACIRRIGVDTGGSNIQFALDPATGDQIIIEMNPRVSRSSALASKATGFPIAKIAARLAVGYRLDEITNDITGETPASFEPTIDYVVTKVPRWAFEKLPGASPVLGTQMQSVGEVMAIGRTFTESLQKALRSLETGRAGLNADPAESAYDPLSDDGLVRASATATPERVFHLEAALRRGVSVERLATATGVDPWFLDQIALISAERADLADLADRGGRGGAAAMTRSAWRRAKRLGFSDAQLAYLWGEPEASVRAARRAAGVDATFKTVDTCAAEFEARTPYHYGTYEDETEVAPLDRPAVVILGSGPNRIGQGVEFDYCCVHAAFALSDAGYETVMVNCNPETVSTDYDTSDRLFFEPLTAEDVLNVVEALDAAAVPPGERDPEARDLASATGPSGRRDLPPGGDRSGPEGAQGARRSGELASATGVIVGLGGQTPLKLAATLEAAGVPILGTAPSSIDRAEDRESFNALCEELGIPQPPGGTAASSEAARAVAERIGYPVLVRPSYVLGGRAMQIVYDAAALEGAMAELAESGSLGREGGLSAERPALIDRFLEDAVEVDVDAVRDHLGEVFVAGIMEHIEEAGVHSGDSACAIPPPTLAPEVQAAIEDHTRALAAALEVRGLINVQYAVKDGVVHVIEANPRASRTVPFVSKATGVPVAKVAARVMVGASLAELRAEGLLPDTGESGTHVAVKEAVLPFNRFPGVDTVLGPEMRSTGEVMGIDRTFGVAFVKSQAAGGNLLPAAGRVFLSLADRDKPAGLRAARLFVEQGFSIAATAGTAAALEADGLPVEVVVDKVGEEAGGRDAVELVASGEVDLVVNTPRGRGPRADGMHIRRAATEHKVSCITTVAAALAAAAGIREASTAGTTVRSLQDYHRDVQLRLEV
ncbi:MAG: carbamoyl-phosphate synthase large subunit [Acidimicrobiia bacterium]|nr:carbamoyl-phosphate synthase large subunit [Acidimicrobiia bacterium]